MSQPVEELLRVQIQLGGDLAQLEEFLAIHALEDVDEVLHQSVVHGDAIQKHLKGVLVGVRVRLRGRSVLLRGGRCIRDGRTLGKQLLRQSGVVLRGAGTDKGRHAHGLQLLAQRLYTGALVAAVRQGDTLRCGALALPHLGHILEIVVKKGHSIPHFPTKYLTIQRLPMQEISGMMGR